MRRERPRRVDVGVAVNGAVAQELRVREAGDQCATPAAARQSAAASGIPPGSTSAPARSSWRSCTTAYGSRPVRGSRRPDRLHRPEPQRLAAAARHLLHRQAALEVRRAIEVVLRFVLVGGAERRRERVVLGLGQRGVQVVVPAALPVAGGAEQPHRSRASRPQRSARWRRRRRAPPPQAAAPRWLRQCLGRQRTGRDDAGRRKRRHLIAHQRDPGMRSRRAPWTASANAARSTARADPPGTRASIRGVQHDAPRAPHFGLEQAVGGAQLFGFERIAADQLSETIGLMGRRLTNRPHLVQRDAHTPLRQRPGSLAPREPASDDGGGQVATDSAGAASVSGTSCAHFRHLRYAPVALVCLCSIPR